MASQLNFEAEPMSEAAQVAVQHQAEPAAEIRAYPRADDRIDPPVAHVLVDVRAAEGHAGHGQRREAASCGCATREGWIVKPGIPIGGYSTWVRAFTYQYRPPA